MAVQQCFRYERNKKECPCDSYSCPRRGQCCECVLYHRVHGGAPACFA